MTTDPKSYHLAKAFYYALCCDDLDVAQLCIDKGVDVNKPHATGNIVCSYTVSEKTLEFLFENGYVVPEDKRKAAFQSFCSRGLVDAALKVCPDDFVMTKFVVMDCISNGKRGVELAERLVEKASKIDADFNECWECAASSDGIKFLLDHGADPNRADPCSEDVPLTSVLRYTENDADAAVAIRMMIERGADVNGGTHTTPLMAAAGRGLYECAKTLVDAGANVGTVAPDGTSAFTTLHVKDHKTALKFWKLLALDDEDEQQERVKRDRTG